MNLPIFRTWAAAVAALALFLPVAGATAQEVKPVAVVSIASIDKILADIEHLTDVAGSGDVGKLVSGMAGIYVNGVDRTKPLGAYVVMNSLEPIVTTFVPVKDVKAVLATLRNNGIEGKDAGGGVQEFEAGGQSIFLKEQAGWVFLAQRADQLGKLPMDPSKLIGELDQKYNVAVQINMPNLPMDVKQTAISFIKTQAEAQLRDQIGNPADREAAEKLTKNSVNSLVALIEETDRITLGWGVDKAAKTTYVDFSMTALQGTSTARRAALASEATSGFAGFLLADAAVTFNMTQKLLKEDIESYSALLKPLRTQALKEIDNDPSVPAELRADAKDVLGSLLDVFQGTVESGKIDGGATLLVEPKALTFAAGLYVADGAALEKSVKKGAGILAKTEPDFPKVNFDAEKHGGITFHTLSIPVPAGEAEAQQLLGEQLDVVLGTGAKAFYLAFGKNSSTTLKKVIDQSAADAAKTVPPLQLNVALAPVARTVAATSEDPISAMLADALSKSGGKDHVRVTSKAIPNGVNSRIELEEGVIKVLGQVVRQFAGGAGAPF